MRDNTPQLLTLENGSSLLPSMLCAPTREGVSASGSTAITTSRPTVMKPGALRRAISFNHEEDIDVLGNSVQLVASLHQYVEDPQKSTS